MRRCELELAPTAHRPDGAQRRFNCFARQDETRQVEAVEVYRQNTTINNRNLTMIFLFTGTFRICDRKP